jgi:hypothetical protein
VARRHFDALVLADELQRLLERDHAGGISRTSSSAADERIFVSFFSFVGLDVEVPAYFFAAAAAVFVASTISAPLTALANEDAARLVLALSSNCPLCSSFSPLLFITTKRNFSPLLRISILPAIIVLSS